MIKRSSQLLLLLMFVSMIGCATMQVETNGAPIPNYIVRANLPSSGIVIDTTIILNYNEKEGGEFLHKSKYLDSREQEHVLNEKYIRNLTLAIRVKNPDRNEYQLWLHRELYTSDKTYSEAKKEMVYGGRLSMKEFFIELPTVRGSWGKASYELRDVEGNMIFQGLQIRYRVPAI